MATPEERNLIRRAFAEGPSILLEEGYTAEMIRSFMDRADVQAEIQLLQIEFNNQEAMFGRSVFLAKRNLAKLAPGAAAVLGQALSGPIYRRDKDGNVINDANGNPVMQHPGVTTVQLRAAEAIMESMGVDPKSRPDKAADANLVGAFKPPVAKVDVDDKKLLTEDERTISRERVRNVILQLRDRLPALRKKVDETIKKKGKKVSTDTVSKPET